ncbi:MAG: hypothetical protein RLZZ387_3116 [Chloroflexota bacterium]
MSSNSALEASPAPRRPAPWRVWALLAVVLLVGGSFRTLGLTSWDGTSYLHPDERFLIFTVYNMQTPESFGDYLRSDCFVDGNMPAASNPAESPDRQEPTAESGCNTLNPRNYNWSRFFVYGTLPTTLTRLVAEELQQTQPADERDVSAEDVRNTGRALSTLFDLGSVVLVFLIGRRLYGERAGLVAAALYACAALPIQLAHFFTVDAATGFFVLLSVYWSVRAMQGGGAGTFAALGLSIGAAMACRVTMATLGLLAVLAVAVRLWGSYGTRTVKTKDSGRAGVGPSPASVVSLLALLALSGALTLLTFRVLQPDAFVGTSFFDIRPEPRFLKNIEEVGGMVSGEVDFPPSQQWAGRTPYLFSWQNMVVWGMGLPLGLAAWAGWAAAGWRLVRRRELAHLLPWVWVAFYFAWQGGQFVMTMRYYALLYGLLALFAAWLLTRGWQQRPATDDRRPALSPQGGGGSWSAAARWIPLGVVVLSTVLWGYAFTRIYTEPHSRIQASRWIYENIPPGSAITFEEWDDPLPLAIDGQNPSQYVGIKTAPYWEDDPVKYFGSMGGDGTLQPGLLDQLDQADYLIFSSNRVYDSATRLRMRYPALTRYYHHLFSGELGFELAADIHSYPRLFGIGLPSPLYAEEAFSVYDHPRVLIFKKTPAYTRENAEQLIAGGVAWGEVYKLPTLTASKVPTALRLTDAQWPSYREAGTWSALFGGGLVSLAPWLFWLLALELLGAACFALLFRLLPGLADRGFALSKTLGLLLVAYLAWLLASLGADDGAPLVAFGPGGVWLCAALLILAGGLMGWRGRDALLAFWRRRRHALLAAEGLFLAAFLGFVLLRALNPDLWHPARGGEKPMDVAFLNAVLKSPAFPPYDPWFAGGYINYYYFGFVLVGALVHMTGIAPGVAYNLAVPTIFALAALGAWGVAYNLVAPRMRTNDEAPKTRDALSAASDAGIAAAPSPSVRWLRRDRLAIAAGVAAAVLAVVAGNLVNAVWLLPGSANTADAGIPAECQAAASYAAQNECRGRAEWAFWDATRIVGMALGDGSINEFPFFTFLYGDLHAHMIALPLTLAALGLILAIVRGARRHDGRRREASDPWPSAFGRWSSVFLLALVAGALRATNTWDYPTALGLGVLGLGLVSWQTYRRGLAAQTALVRWVVSSALLVGLSVLLFLPFTRHFATDYAGFELWQGTRTPALEFLKINGLWLFLVVSAGLVLYVRLGRIARLAALAVAMGLALAAAGAALGGMDALPLQALLVALGVVATGSLALRAGIWPAPHPERHGPLTPVNDEGPVQLALPLEEPEPHTAHRPTPAGAPVTSALTLLAALWATCAVGITLLTEVVAAKGDIGRMNTVFKFGMQSWLLFAVLSGVALVWLWTSLGASRQAPYWKRATGLSVSPRPLSPTRQSLAVAWVWRAAATLLVGAALAYPLTATPARLADRFDTSIGPTLDGEAFMRSEKASWGENGQSFTLEQDADAIAWVRQNVAGTPVVLEAHAEAYRWAGRFSVYTGLPTLIGWPWHMIQQRSVADAGPVVASRQAMVRQLYDGTDPDAALKDLRLYGVEYVVVGHLERALYSPQGLMKFDELAQRGAIEVAYEAGETRIYRVPPADTPPATLHTTVAVRPPADTGKDLMLSVPVDTLPPVDEVAWNALARNQVVAVVLWLLAWYGLAALGLPLAALVLGRTPLDGISSQLTTRDSRLASGWNDGGWAWSRLVGMLLLGYAVWLPVSARLWQYDRWGLLTGVVLVVALNGLLLWRSGLGPLRAHLRAHRRQILQVEALFLGAFGFMVGVRALNPDLWQPIWGGEKPFEFGFLNAMLRTPVMPPYNPFYSDGVINYYYYGFFLVSLPLKATGIEPAVGFNLIVATLFALLLAGAFALVARAGGWRLGLLGAALVGVVSNLAGVVDASWLGRGGLAPALEALRGGLPGFGERLGDWFMGASRVVPYTINEFPYFSYLFADLHPHMIALPITILMVAIVWELFAGGARARGEGPMANDRMAPSYSRWSSVLGLWSLAALTLGALAVTNSWDFPTYGLLLGGALLGRAWRAPAESALDRVFAIVGAALSGMALGGAALLLYLPFFQGFQAPVTGLGMVTSATSVSDYLLLYGLFLVVLLPAVFGAAWRLLRAHERRGRAAEAPDSQAVGFVAGVPGGPGVVAGLRAGLTAAAILVALIAVGQTARRVLVSPEGEPLPDLFASVLGLRLWLAALTAVGVGVLLSRRIGPRAWFTTWLAVVGWIVSLLFELVYVRDHLAGGDWYRMNTVFKFGLQAWVLMALAAALALPGVWRGIGRSSAAARGVYGVVLSVLVALSLVYPLVGTPSRAALRFERNPGPTLDGLAFLETGTFPVPSYLAPADEAPQAPIELRHDGEAIRWLLDNLRGTPVVLQSSLEFYRAYGTRVAANTGFPTVVSPLHESEQRDGELVAQRDRDVGHIYRTLDEEEALRLLSRYRVGYVVVGPIERLAYGEAGARKWDVLTRPSERRPEYLTLVFSNEQTQIYQVSEKTWGLPKLPDVDPPEPVVPRPLPDPVIAEPAPEAVVPEVPAPQESAAQPDLAELERQVNENPAAAGPAFALGQLYWQQGRMDEAAAVLGIAARANPNDVGLHHMLADVLLDAERYDEAEAALRAAVQASPTPGNWNKLGMGLLRAGRTDAAEQAFREALTVDANEPEPYVRLGQLYEQRGDREQAAEHYRRYLELAPSGPYRPDAEEGLARVS